MVGNLGFLCYASIAWRQFVISYVGYDSIGGGDLQFGVWWE